MVLVAGIALLASRVTQASPLLDYTGYTRVGTPVLSEQIPLQQPASAEKNAVGVTIYFTVLERRDGRAGSNDVFGTGIPNFDRYFIADRDGEDAGRLDVNARYLYLYQIANDSGRRANVLSATVRLLVPPQYITSWGYFAGERRENKEQLFQGVGFASPARNAADDGGIVPASTAFPALFGKSPRYSSPAPAVVTRNPFRFATIGLNQPAILPASQLRGEDRGRPPQRVILVRNVDFSLTAEMDDEQIPRDNNELTATEELDLRRVRAASATRRQGWGIRAVFHDLPVGLRERSPLFGFTSNLPPTMSGVVVRSENIAGIAPAAGVNPGGINPASAVGPNRGTERLPTPKPATLIVGPDGKTRIGTVGLDNKAIGPDGQEIGTIAPNGQVIGPDGKSIGQVAPVGQPVAPNAGGIAPAAGDGKGVGPASAPGDVPGPAGDIVPAAGTVPTPTPAALESGAATAGSTSAGGAPGIFGGLGGQPGGAGVLPPVTPPAATFAPRGLNGGGGLGGGLGGGQGEGQAQEPITGQDQTSGINNVNNINIDVRQQQQQQQKQKQQQNQQQNQNQQQSGGNGVEPIPAPAAWLLGVLGLPILFLVGNSKKARRAEAAIADQKTAP